MKIREALAQGTKILKNGNSEINMPLLDAELILCHITGKDRTYIICHDENELTYDVEKTFFVYIEKRASGCPIAYITGKKEFMSIELSVNENVLIPRDDTEILVNHVLDLTKLYKNPKILNIGSGSGCIEIALTYYNKYTTLTGIEKYENAMDIARKNIERYSLSDRIELIKSDMFEKIDENKRFDIICSNPPYITKEEMDNLSIDVKEYEPYNALFGGQDGLDFYRVIAGNAKKYLSPNGFVAVEIGYSQKDSVFDIFLKNGYKNIICYKDLSGYYRVITAKYTE